MEIPRYLAMTSAEFQKAAALPAYPAWMACHFSSYGTGLSNVPKTLPPGSMLMLNDRTPLCGHDPVLVAEILCGTAQNLECSRILLDFQREGYPEILDVIQEVLAQASCPVGVSSLYAAEFDCPVLVPPIPPHILPEKAVKQQAGRELWLEITTEGTKIEVTTEGSHYAPIPNFFPEATFHSEPELYCHYQITAKEDRVIFQLTRTEEDQSALINAVKSLGVTCAVGLWQEMNR